MRRRVPARLALLVAVATFGLSPAGCGSSATTSSSTTSSGATTPHRPGTSTIPHAPLTVTPTAGGPTTAFRFSFRAPEASGRHGATAASYELSVVGPHGAVMNQSMAVPAVSLGQAVTVSMGPAGSAAAGTAGPNRWCAGTYTARVDESERPICTGGQMCPQFIRLLAEVGPVTFRVTN